MRTGYQGAPGGPRDPATPGSYCLGQCYCGTCPQYAEQQARVAQQRADEYQARIRREGEQWANQQKRGNTRRGAAA